MNETMLASIQSRSRLVPTLLLAALPLLAANAADVAERIPDSYARPVTLVSIDNTRHLNLRCTGSGTPTIVLESGSHADSSTWFRLQPLLEKSARVCAYDRAGYGFSDEGPLPRNLDADVADLHALIHDAHLVTPLLLVGHSLGSNIVRRYADKYPHAVAGLVLIDPPEQNVAAIAPAWAKDDAELSKQRLAFIRQCGKGAEQGLLAAPPDNLKRCISPVVPFANAKVTAAVVGYKMKPGYWHTLLSELQNNQIVFAQPVSAHENHGSMSLVVLTADNTYADAPAPVRKLLEAARESTQSHIVATSTGGKRVFVKNTSHDIQIDQPQAVADAILAMISNRQMATQPKR